MHRHLKIMVMLASLMSATLVGHAAKWEIAATSDPITDQTTYHVWTFGSEIQCSYGEFSPKLAVRIIPPDRNGPKGSRSTFDVFIFSPAIKRKTPAAAVDMILRYDDGEVMKCTWSGSDNRCALFCDNPTNTLSHLRAARKLAIRFVHRGQELTSIFDTSELPEALNNVKADYLKRIGKLPDQPAHNPSPCRKCKGKGTTTGWVNCPGCGGQVMSGGSRCKTCIRSIRVGKVRGDIPCPECSTPAQVTHAPFGYARAMRGHIRNEINAELDAEADAAAFGYYAESKSWMKARRISAAQP